jgi:hypothetical protein
MNEEILKGNFKVKKPVSLAEAEAEKKSVREQLRKKAIASIGGSMVYMERTDLAWDGEEKTK